MISRLLFVTLLAACGRLSFDPIDNGTGGDGGARGDAAVLGNIAFISSTEHDGALGGVTVADGICQSRATEAGLPGTFVSLLRDSTRGHIDLLAGSRGWTDVTGVPIADVPEDWFTGGMIYPLSRDEYGVAYSEAETIFTGGTSTCGDWMSTTGLGGIGRPNAAFFDFGSGQCITPRHLPCVEIGRVTSVRPPIAEGRDAFVTDSGFVASSGYTGADALCMSEATGAGRSGTFRALLEDDTTPGPSRFSLVGLPWRRTDGVLLADTPAGLFDPAQRRTFLTRNAAGTPRGTFINVWRGNATAHCNRWTSTAVMGVAGEPSSIGPSFDWVNQTGCPNNFQLICLQE